MEEEEMSRKPMGLSFMSMTRRVAFAVALSHTDTKSTLSCAKRASITCRQENGKRDIEKGSQEGGREKEN